MPPVHHRRVAAARNEERILDATVGLLEDGRPVSISGVAAAAGLSRPTVYAHFGDRSALIAAVVERTVRSARGAIEGAAPDEGDALDALDRVAAACWQEIHRHAAVTRASAGELPDAERRRLHEDAFAPLERLIARGRADGSFRTDAPPSWLLSVFYGLLHATADEVLAGRAEREAAGPLLASSLRRVFARS